MKTSPTVRVASLLLPVPPDAQASAVLLLQEFTDVHNLYRDAIVRYCYRNCRDRDIAEDLAQATFLRFWLCLQEKKEILFARAFLYRIAHNLFIDHVRRKKETSLDELLEVGFEPSVDPWDHTYSILDARRPLKKLAAMSKSHKQVLQYRFMKGLAPNEIATLTGESANTVSVRIFRGLKELRGLLRELEPSKK